ncbi:MAG: DUF2270 domain-containing protein [Pyrinomonadaceae bacterium]
MAINTEPTPRIPEPGRTEGIHDSRITTRVPLRPSGPLSRESASTERATGRLRPISTPSIHETVTPDRKQIAPVEVARRLSPAEFNTSMVHFYRGEVQRSNTWRNRLDTTTNWAVLSAGAMLSFAFSSPNTPHFVIPVDSILVAVFLVMEARRYRYYEIWSSRVRVIETGYLATMLAPESVPRDQEWASHLASDLLTPHFTISVWEAIGRRLRRNYIWLFALLALSWNLKVYLYPTPAPNFNEFILRAQVGLVPGWIVFLVGFIFNAALFVFAVGTIRLREATGEVLPRHQFSLHPLRAVSSWTRAASSGTKATVRRAKRARHRLRGGTSGEYRKIDVTQTPDRKIHASETPDRRSHISETPDRIL